MAAKGYGQPAPQMSVKNTFIDFNDAFDEVMNERAMRQTSEPVPRRQTSGWVAGTHLQGLDEEYSDNDEPDNEPYQNRRHHQLPLSRIDPAGGHCGARGYPDMSSDMNSNYNNMPSMSGMMPPYQNVEGQIPQQWSGGMGMPNGVMIGVVGIDQSMQQPPAPQMQDNSGPGNATKIRNAGPPPAGWANTLTVMMRNVPNKYTQGMLLTELNETNFLGAYDFLYLPIDPETNANRGYSFINFIDSECAWAFKVTYEGRKMNHFNSSKHVSVVPATLQGFEANYAHYSTSRVSRGDPAARPLFLRQPSQVMNDKMLAQQRRGRRRRGIGSAVDVAGAMKEHEEVGYAGDTADHLQQTAAAMASSGVGQKQVHGAFAAASAAAALGGDYKNQARSGNGQRCAANATTKPKFCPYCGGEMSLEFRFCQFCGSSLERFVASQTQPQMPTQQTQQMRLDTQIPQISTQHMRKEASMDQQYAQYAADPQQYGNSNNCVTLMNNQSHLSPWQDSPWQGA